MGGASLRDSDGEMGCGNWRSDEAERDHRFQYICTHFGAAATALLADALVLVHLLQSWQWTQSDHWSILPGQVGTGPRKGLADWCHLLKAWITSISPWVCYPDHTQILLASAERALCYPEVPGPWFQKPSDLHSLEAFNLSAISKV